MSAAIELDLRAGDGMAGRGHVAADCKRARKSARIGIGLAIDDDIVARADEIHRLIRAYIVQVDDAGFESETCPGRTERIRSRVDGEAVVSAAVGERLCLS